MTPEPLWRPRARIKTRCVLCPQVVTVLTHRRRSQVKVKTLHRTEHSVSFPFLYFFLRGGGPHIAVSMRWKWESDAKKDRAEEVERTWGWKVSWQTGRRLAACFLFIDDFLVTQQHVTTPRLPEVIKHTVNCLTTQKHRLYNHAWLCETQTEHVERRTRLTSKHPRGLKGLL